MKLNKLRRFFRDIDSIEDGIERIEPEQEGPDYTHTFAITYDSWKILLQLVNSSKVQLIFTDL